MVRLMNVVLKGNPLDCPFAPKKKNDPITLGALLPSIISGGAGVLSNLFGGLFGSSSQSSANAANLEMTKMNNDTQKQLAREANAMSQQQFNENMKWLREQYYDTEQMKRAVQSYKSAGLNPALAYGAPNTVGSVGAPSQSQFHVAQTEAGHVDPYMPDFDGLSETFGHSVDAYFNNQLINAQTENVKQEGITKRINNFTQFARDVADLRSKYVDIELKLSQKGVSDATRDKLLAEKEEIENGIKLFWSQFEDLKNQPKYSNKLLNAQADEVDSRTVLNKIEAEFKPLILRAGLKVSQSQAAQLNALSASLWEEAKTKYHYRNDVMPLDVIEKKLSNGILSTMFGEKVSYEKFLKSNEFSDWRNFIKLFGEFLFRLQPK